MPYRVSANNRIYTVVNDLQSSYQVLVSGVVEDELTGESPVGELSVSLNTTNEALKTLVLIKILEGGLFCLAGEVARVFPHVSDAPSSLDLQVRVPGYKDIPSLTVPIPQNSTFPVTPAAIQMQRLPVRISGRVVESTVNATAISGVRVRLVDEPHPPAMLTEHVVALRAPLCNDHAQGTKIRQRRFDMVGVGKHLAVGALLGSQTFILSDLTGLAANNLLHVGTDAAGEYVVIDELLPDAAGQVLLHSPLNRSYVAGTPIQKYAPGIAGTDAVLTRKAAAGESVLFLHQLLQAAPGSVGPLPKELPVDTIEIADVAAGSVEYNALGAMTDSGGYYQLNGISRVRTVHMDASEANHVAMKEPKVWTIDYGQTVNHVDFQLLHK